MVASKKVMPLKCGELITKVLINILEEPIKQVGYCGSLYGTGQKSNISHQIANNCAIKY